jgi:excisionase family DNA binding protein
VKVAAATAARVVDGAQVRKLRRAASLTQAQLGAATGVAQAVISQIEAGRVTRPACLPGLAAALGVAEPDLLVASTAPPATAAAPAPRRDLPGIQFMTAAEVATALRVSKMTVYRLVHAGELEAIRVGRSFRIPSYAVTAYLHSAHYRGPLTQQPAALDRPAARS